MNNSETKGLGGDFVSDVFGIGKSGDQFPKDRSLTGLEYERNRGVFFHPQGMDGWIIQAKFQDFPIKKMPWIEIQGLW